jgi:excisionase family DNA binding protein
MAQTLSREDTRPLLSPAEVAERLGVSRKSVYRLVRSGELPAVKIGHAVRVDPDELEQYIYGGQS